MTPNDCQQRSAVFQSLQRGSRKIISHLKAFLNGNVKSEAVLALMGLILKFLLQKDFQDAIVWDREGGIEDPDPSFAFQFDDY